MPNRNPPPQRLANTTLAAVAALMTAAPAPVMAAPVPPLVRDGTPTDAACREFGFHLTPPTPPITRRPPPPVAVPIAPTKKEDRVQYSGPPVIAPGPPPPIGAPPPPVSYTHLTLPTILLV